MTTFETMTPHTMRFLGEAFGIPIVIVVVAAILVALFQVIAKDGNPPRDPDVVEVLGIGEETTSWVRGRRVKCADVDGSYGRHSATAVQR